ncbi:MAG: hypothetical protein IMF19_05145, partial [Proteobacteria bacterium]|nr:hypothetical protein [Pseudomonadota bacterium]
MKNKILASMQKEASEFIKDPKNKMREWWDKWWEFMKDSKKKMRKWWDKLKFKHPWKACSLQYGVLALVVLGCHVLSRIVSGMTNVDYFRYPLSETFRHPFNLTANL